MGGEPLVLLAQRLQAGVGAFARGARCRVLELREHVGEQAAAVPVGAGVGKPGEQALVSGLGQRRREPHIALRPFLGLRDALGVEGLRRPARLRASFAAFHVDGHLHIGPFGQQRRPQLCRQHGQAGERHHVACEVVLLRDVFSAGDDSGPGAHGGPPRVGMGLRERVTCGSERVAGSLTDAA